MSPFASQSVWARDTMDEIKQAPETFSSWDKCMAEDYCKWPVIVGIIVGSIILLSIIACIINCLCCGIQCCKCCGCCSCCCPSPRKRPDRSKFLDDPTYHQPPPPPPDNPYRPPPMPAYRGAQVARFDTPSTPGPKVNEDALPEMPSWDSAVTRRVEDPNAPQQEDVEMEPLNPTQHRTPSPMRPNLTPVPPPTSTTTYAGYRGLDDVSSSYTPRSPSATASPAPFSAYDNSYRDYSSAYANPYQSRTATPAAAAGYNPRSGPYNPNPTPPMPIPMAVSSPSEMSRYSPFQRQPSPASMQPPPSYVSQPQTPYRGMSPSIPTSPPPPFASSPGPYEVSGSGRPPTLLQSGRKPMPNSYRDV